MKRINNLFDKIISIENLEMADEMARRGKKNKYGIRLHDQNRESNIRALHELLKNNQYRTSKYDVFTVFTPKEREISRLPYYPDRIVHWAIMIVLEPIWVKIFTSDSYSCIKGRGIHGAARKMHEALKDTINTQYCLKIDIKKFYPNIDQKILLNIIERKIKDKRLLLLLEEIIFSVPRGVPIGNYISQYAANLYLTYFDHYVKEVLKVKHYFRYCDDMVFLSESKDDLKQIFYHIDNYLNEHLNLTIKENWQIFPVSKRGIDFVGYRFFHTHVLMRKTIKKNYARKAARLRSRNVSRFEYTIGLAAYYGWAKQPFCNSINFIKKIYDVENAV